MTSFKPSLMKAGTFWACALVGVGSASAQTVLAEGSAVGSRARPDYDPLGIQLGGFTAFPSLTLSTGYDDNIFSRETPKTGDGFYSIEPNLSVRSNWSRNSLGLDLDGRFNRYYSDSVNNNDQYSAKANGTYEVSRTFLISADGGYTHAAEPRGSYGDIFTGGDPIEYNEYYGDVSVSNQFNRISTRLSGSFNQYDYDNVRINGQDISLKYRNYQSISGTGRISYSIGPRLQAFVQGQLNQGRYTDQTADTINRNSHGYQVLGGVAFGLTELLYGEVALGYLHQSYENAAFFTSKGLSYSATLHWNPTELITVTGNVNRSVERAALTDTPSVILSGGNLSADYELLRNLILHFGATYQTASYKGEDRRDHLFTGTVGAKYLINHLMDATLTYNYRNQRSSGIFARQYTGNRITVGIAFHR